MAKRKAGIQLEKGLSRRERQIMDVLYRLGRASAAEIREAIPDAPSYSAVRTLLTILNEKGHVQYQQDGAKYVYQPVVPRDEMARSVIKGVTDTFFGGSIERVVAALIDERDAGLTEDQIKTLTKIIEDARRQGR